MDRHPLFYVWLAKTNQSLVWSSSTIIKFWIIWSLSLSFDKMNWDDIKVTAPCFIGCTLHPHRRNIKRTDKFIPQYMRVSEQASHLLYLHMYHEVVVFYDTPSLVIFCYCPSNISSCALSAVQKSMLATQCAMLATLGVLLQLKLRSECNFCQLLGEGGWEEQEASALLSKKRGEGGVYRESAKIWLF